MTRFFFVLLATQLAALVGACGMSSERLTPAQALAQADSALAAGDADRAVALLRQAGDAGHLGALRQLEGAYRHGMVHVGADVLPVRQSEWRADRVRRDYDRALVDSIRAGKPDAILWASKETMGMRMFARSRDDLPEPIRARYWDAVDVDSVRTLYARLDPAALSPRQLVQYGELSQALGHRETALRVYDQAIAGGDRGACVYKIQAVHGPSDLFSAAGLADVIDRSAECDPNVFADGSSLLDGVRESARSGTLRSAEVMDSLAVLGVFDRHPTLTASRP